MFAHSSNKADCAYLLIIQLKQKYPDFFDGESNKKALKHAVSYIKQRHGQWRYGLGLGGVGSHYKSQNKDVSVVFIFVISNY